MPTSTYQQLAERADEATNLLFGLSELGQRLRAATASMQRDCEQLETNRGIKELSVGLVGPKNAGKSALVRLLVPNPAARERVRSGLLTADTTRKLMWLGASCPAAVDQEREEFLRTDLEEIGRPYVVLDVPGFTDGDANARQFACDALASCQLKVLIVQRDEIGAEDTKLHLALADGATVLPFVRAKLPQGGPDAAVRLDIEKFMLELRSAAPRSRIFEATLLPDMDALGAGAEDQVRKRLVAGLRNAVENLGDPRTLVAGQIEARIHRWRRELQKLLTEVRGRVQGTLNKLTNEEETLLAEVLPSFIGSSELLEAGTRMRLRMALMGRLNPVYFPFRPLVALLVLTSGAWDRLIIAMAGSIPSLALVFYTTARNIRDLRRMRAEARNGLERRVLATVRERIQPVVTDFWRGVRIMPGKGDSAAPSSGAVAPSVRLNGLAELQQASTQWFDEALSECKAKAFILHFCALVGTIVFWVFMAGPLGSIYREYFKAAHGALGTEASIWSAFPVPSGSMIFTSLLLSLLPMLVAALVCVAWAVTPGRAKRCAALIRKKHEDGIKKRREDGTLRIEIGDSAMEAARFLINF